MIHINLSIVPLYKTFFCNLFFFNNTAPTEIYTLSLHDALPISVLPDGIGRHRQLHPGVRRESRSEEHTSELQSRLHLVCRLLLEKKKTWSSCRPPRLVS